MRERSLRPLFFFFLLVPALLAAGGPVDRDAFINAFVQKADLVRSLDANIEAAQAEVDRAIWQYFPRIKVTFGMAPFPRYEYEPETIGWKRSYHLGDLGVALRAYGEVTLPIYTFGKIEYAREAAEKGVAVKEAEKKIAVLDLRKQAASFYYSHVMASDMLNMVDLSIEKIVEAEEKLEQWLYDGKEGVSQNDLIKLRIEKERLLFSKDRVLASQATLKALFDRVLGPGYALKDEFMFKVDFPFSREMLESHLIERSSYRSLIVNGLGALESLYRFEKSNFFPNLGAMGNYRIDYTSSVDDRGYPLPSSPYNGYGGEAGVGLEFNLNILEQVAKMRKARSEWKAKEYQASFMIEATLLDLRRKYDELRALDSQVEHLRKAHKMAKGWMTAEFLNYESGMLSTRDLIDAVKAFVEQEYALVNAMYEYNMKVEDLLTTAGFER
ncbi:MAG TPA: TolC family protein [bacterium]|nr:TolC family protein [bacterium]